MRSLKTETRIERRGLDQGIENERGAGQETEKGREADQGTENERGVDLVTRIVNAEEAEAQ